MYPSKALLQQWGGDQVMEAFDAAYHHWQESPLLEGESEYALGWMRETAPFAVKRYLPYVEEKVQQVTNLSFKAGSPQALDLISLEFDLTFRPSVRGSSYGME